MVIAGKWRTFDDGISRPVVSVNALGSLSWRRDDFLVDSGADRTVFCNEFFKELQLPGMAPPEEIQLEGIGGRSEYVVLSTTLEFTTTIDSTARVTGPYSAFLDPEAMDISVLGRDVLANFDVIISRRRNEVLLLAGQHRYSVDIA
jgi:hypothetical protein